MAKIILVTGGTRSGKSAFAEKLALKLGNGKSAYIATAQIFDDEMKARVELHKSRRSDNWTNFESPFDADKILAEIDAETILFDSMSIYITNWLLNKNIDAENLNAEFETYIDKLLAAAENSSATVIFVGDEVGNGIVPMNKLSRVFRDLNGTANQKIAAVADSVYLVVAGLAVEVKSIAFNGGV